MSKLREEYDALTGRCGFAPIVRSQIAMTGKDRTTFLQRFSTNDLRGLSQGHFREAFITSVQGKTLGHVMIYAEPERLILDTSVGQAEKLIKHLDRYTLRDDVQFVDLTAETCIFVIGGPHLKNVLESLPPLKPGIDLRGSEYGRGLTVFAVGTPANSDLIATTLRSAGAKELSTASVEACRIEAGFPLYGQDITDDNLPQEVDRNTQAISFTKGCYLGQETVARIDALGHVNKLLRGLKFSSVDPPAPGTALFDQDETKPMGAVTSSAFSPRFDCAIGLGYVRRQQSTPGTRLRYAGGEVEVLALPMV